jgi:hypothetical protein
MAHSRRDFIKHGAASVVGLFTFVVAGCQKRLTLTEARTIGVACSTFDKPQVRTLEALGEILLPGSAALGLAHFIDHQLSGPAANSMLMIKYLGLSAPFTDFYKSGLAGVESAARDQFSQPFTALTPKDAQALVARMAKDEPPRWSGPPSPLFFFVLRNDAVDATYGTVAGFESLGVPYMAHITPPTRWGE